MLIDFDWCDKAGEGRYPMGINQQADWPKGVGPGSRAGENSVKGA